MSSSEEEPSDSESGEDEEDDDDDDDDDDDEESMGGGSGGGGRNALASRLYSILHSGSLEDEPSGKTEFACGGDLTFMIPGTLMLMCKISW